MISFCQRAVPIAQADVPIAILHTPVPAPTRAAKCTCAWGPLAESATFFLMPPMNDSADEWRACYDSNAKRCGCQPYHDTLDFSCMDRCCFGN